MSSELLASIAGVVLSLAFSYIPGLNAWYAVLEPIHKRLIMMALILAVAFSAFGLSCAGWWPTVTCDQAGISGLIEVFVKALIANQAAYLISPVSEAAKAARLKAGAPPTIFDPQAS